MTPAAMKLFFQESPLGPETFADFDAADDAAVASCLLVYVGGAIRPTEYARRRESVPDGPFTEARAAGWRGPMLVLSAPPGLPGLAREAVEPLTRHFADELLPAIGFAPSAIALVGFSFGASLAVLLARNPRFPIRALAVMAPAGAAEAADLSDASLGPLACPVLIATNLDDPYREYADTFAAAANRHGIAPVKAVGPGEHRFVDYAANGLAARAFGFVARHLETAAYAASVAGTHDDLDPDLERAAVEHLKKSP